MSPSAERWLVAALWLACAGFVLWFAMDLMDQDWNQTALSTLAVCAGVLLYGPPALLCGLAVHGNPVPKAPRRARWYAGAFVMTAAFGITCALAFVAMAFIGHFLYWLLFHALAYGVALWLANKRLPVEARVEFQRIDGPGGPGPLAPA
jgi:hypothetical protein